MDRNFRNDLRKETEDVYKALEAYLRGDSDALQLTGKNGIEGIYRIEHRTLKFMIMQKAVEDPKWRELYINYYENNKQRGKNPEYSDIINMILLSKSIRSYSMDYLNIPYETFKTYIEKFKADERVPNYIKELLAKRNKAFRKRKLFVLTQEEKEQLIEFIRKCENGAFDSNTKNKEDIVKAAKEYIGKKNLNTGKDYTMKEIAAMLGIGESTLRRYLQEDEIKKEINGGAK